MYEVEKNLTQNINSIWMSSSLKKIKKRKLKKEKNNDYNIYTTPKVEDVKLTKEDLDKIKIKYLGPNILKFRKRLCRFFCNKNLTILNTNLKTVEIKKRYFCPEILLLKLSTGRYNTIKNVIKLYWLDKAKALNHELFHLSSNIYDENNKKVFTGFSQVDLKKKSVIGVGLNEGYTTLLTSDYFNYIDSSYSYKVCSFFASNLQEIVGKKKMQGFYLNANLKGIINYLEKFDTKENIINFITTLDYIFEHINEINNNWKKYQKMFELLECYLYKWFLKSKQEELNNNVIDIETLNKENSNFKNYIYDYSLKIYDYIGKKEYCLK